MKAIFLNQVLDSISCIKKHVAFTSFFCKASFKMVCENADVDSSLERVYRLTELKSQFFPNSQSNGSSTEGVGYMTVFGMWNS